MPNSTPVTPPPPSDAELDIYIRTRYALLGIDISVLPEVDDSVPMDQQRLLANGRGILRSEATAADLDIDPQFYLPMPFPPQLHAWAREDNL